MRRQAAWAVLGLVVVFLALLARDFYTQKIDFSMGLTQYWLELSIALGCIVGVYLSILLFWPGQLTVNSDKQTLGYAFSSLWVWEREYSVKDFRSIEIRSSGKKEAKEYHLHLKGKEAELSLVFWDLKEATEAARAISETGGIRNKGYVGVQR